MRSVDAPTVIDGRYQLGRLLGTGGMGRVYQAFDLQVPSGLPDRSAAEGETRPAREVAIKVMALDVVTPADIARFEREARAARMLVSPHVAQVYDFRHGDRGVVYIVMEYLVGETLAARLGREPPLPVPQFLGFMIDVLMALELAHAAGVVHRDLKPENIFLVGDPPQLKVIDFGIAKILEESPAFGTLNSKRLGTPLYMAPEQITGEPVDHRADVFAVGVLLYRFFAGRFPFDASSALSYMLAVVGNPITPLTTLRPELPRAINDAVMSALAQKTEQRIAAHPLRLALQSLRGY